ncbi:MAG: hypothetical protein ABI693_29420 [Bryobacteraceae bacterium]
MVSSLQEIDRLIGNAVDQSVFLLPAGITIYGRVWSEPLLLKFAYAYEQATHHRRAPSLTPPLQ